MDCILHGIIVLRSNKVSYLHLLSNFFSYLLYVSYHVIILKYILLTCGFESSISIYCKPKNKYKLSKTIFQQFWHHCSDHCWMNALHCLHAWMLRGDINHNYFTAIKEELKKEYLLITSLVFESTTFHFWLSWLIWVIIFCSVPHLQTVIQLLANMESCQLNSLSQAHLPKEVYSLSLSLSLSLS